MLLKGIITGLYVLVCLLLIGVIIMQSGKSAGISGSIGGVGSDSFLGKKKGLDEWLTKVTVWVGVVFGGVSLLLAVWE